MIRLYSGTPGSGKSLHAAGDVLEALTDGYNVIANFPVELKVWFHKVPPHGRYFYADNSKLTVSALKQFAKSQHIRFKEHQTLLIIDECGMLFNPRAWKDADRNGWLQFFAQHRKLGYDVILIAQMDKQLDKQILGCIEEEHKHRAVKNYKWFGRFLSAFLGGLFMDVIYWYPCRLKVGHKFFTYNPRKAAIYDTFKIFE